MGEDALVLPLGDRFKDLLHYFLSIDRVYCFLKRTKAPVISLQRISTVYNSLFGTDSFDEEKLKILCMLNNKLMRLRSEERDGMETELVIFEYIKLTAGSDLCAAKRKKSCEESILAYLKDKHRSNSLYSSWDLSRGWHPDFSVDEVELPVPCVVSSNPPSKKVKDPLSTSTTENLMAAIAGNDTAKINEAIEALKRLDFYRNQIQYSKLIPGAKAIFGVLSTPLHPLLQRALERRNIDMLYAHQVKGIEALLSGKHVIVTTGTGSGKSLIYNIPILHSHLTLTSPATALYLFPTKVLAQDQLATLSSLSEGMGVFASTFDGDTPPRERDNLRQRCGKGTVLLTNPDTLHCTLLPGHKLWCDFFSSLKFVVLDEAHTYCGGFGTHVAMVLRRLLRVCASYGCRPQFICCSASVRNPLKLMKSLLPVVALKGGEEGIVVVDQDTSARGNRLLLVWNPHNFVSKPKPHNVAFQNEGSGGVVDVSTNVEKGKRALQLARSPVKSPSKFDGVRESLLPMLKRQRRALKSIPPSADQCLLGLDGGGLESRSVQAFLKGCEDGQGNFSPEGPEVIWQGRKRRKGSAENYPSIDLLSGGIGQSDCPDAGSSSNASSTEEARRLFLFLLLQQTNLRALLFAPSRKLVDSITASCSNDLDTIPSPSLLATSILGYRAGYSSEDRRRVEASMLHGKSIRGIVATSAMELGVDIGDLGATVHLGSVDICIYWYHLPNHFALRRLLWFTILLLAAGG